MAEKIIQQEKILEAGQAKKAPNVFSILKPYAWLTTGLVLLGLATNGLNLVLPKVIAQGIDTYAKSHTVLTSLYWEFFFLALGTFVFAYLQSVAQTYVAEKVAKNIRQELISKISFQSYSYIQEVGGGRMLTNLTSDVDNIKNFVAQAVVSILSSIFLIAGAAVLMLMINWQLALAVLAVLPLIGITFGTVFSKLQPLFKKSQGVIDWLNKIINESILGASLVRVLNSGKDEYEKFVEANTKSKDIGIETIRLFAVIFPIIGLLASSATLIILVLGGHFIITGAMSIGNFTAFVTYLGIIIFPVIMIGFMSSAIGQASASYSRVYETLTAEEKKEGGSLKADIKGDVAVEGVTLTLGEKEVLKDITFEAKAGTKTAVLGPTAAGKTHLLYMLIGIIPPVVGTISYDGKRIGEYDKDSLHSQVGFVFQDSSIFNLSVRENIAFSKKVTDEDLSKAIETAELRDFVDALPEGLNTIVSERGTTLSGGQKQRIMLARALALNPKVLLLDDFTARVDTSTERKILANIEKNYPGITLISVTQKIASVEHYDQIVLLMEGELLAKGTHAELMQSSPEYVQIFESQKSTNKYDE